MAILTPEVVHFAAGNTDFYEAALENYLKPAPEQSKILNAAFFAEIEKKSGVAREGLAPEAWVSHPLFSGLLSLLLTLPLMQFFLLF